MRKKVQLVLIVAAVLLAGCKTDDNPPKEVVTPVVSVDSTVVLALSITTENGSDISSRDSYVNCSLSISSTNTDWNFTGSAKIKGRGNSTWLWYPKKPYRIKLNEKATILGLKEDKDWVLLANYRDPTNLMNCFVFNMRQAMGAPYCNHSRFVDVTLNSSYIGLYMLTEQIEQGDNRVAIDSKEGVLLSLDVDDGPAENPSATDNFWSSTYQMPVCVKSPEITSASQLTTIRSEFSELENAIKNADYSAVSQLMDVNSLIDFLIIQELVYNVELSAPRSMYLFRSQGGKWTMGPLWDFDAGFDFDWSTMYTGHNYFSSYKELVMGTNPLYHTQGYDVPDFFTNMFLSKQFVSKYKTRWAEISPKIMAEYWATTQKFADCQAASMAKNATRWPIDKSYKTEIPRLKQWLTNRVSYLNTVVANYPAGTK